MKIQKTNNLLFQKKLIATCAIGQSDKSKKACIYELDSQKDSFELHKMYYDNKWQNNNYLEEITEEYERPNRRKQDRYFIIEDQDKNIVCISVLDTCGNSQNTLEYIETAPSLSCYNINSRPIKFIGETMIAFLAKLTQQQKKDLFVLEVAPKEPTRNFYFEHCGFTSIPENNAIMNKDKLEGLIRMNEDHTGSKIEIIA